MKQDKKKTLPVIKQQSNQQYTILLLISAFVAFLGAQFLGPSILAFTALVGGVKSTKLVDFFETPSMRFVLILTIEAITIWAVTIFMKKRGWKWSDLGLGRRPKWIDAGHGFLAYIAYFILFCIVYAIENATKIIDTNQAQQLGFENVSGLSLVFVFMSLVLLPPIAEEILFRGYIFMGLRKKLTFIRAGLITSVLFGIAHLEFGNGGPLNWAAAIDTFTLSCVLVYITEKTKSLWPAILVHTIKNSLAFVLLFVIK